MSEATEPPPPEVAGLLELLGEEALVALIERFGGARLYVNAKRLRRLSEIIGEDAAKLLSAEWGGDVLKVPLAKRWMARLYRSRGMSYTEIGLALRSSQSAVHRWLSDDRPSPQMSLAFPPASSRRPRAGA